MKSDLFHVGDIGAYYISNWQHLHDSINARKPQCKNRCFQNYPYSGFVKICVIDSHKISPKILSRLHFLWFFVVICSEYMCSQNTWWRILHLVVTGCNFGVISSDLQHRNSTLYNCTVIYARVIVEIESTMYTYLGTLIQSCKYTNTAV